MPRRYLFGPVTRDFADQNLRQQRQTGACLAFNHAGDTDLTIGPDDDWATICSRFPPGWQPDFIALYLPYTSIPASLWTAPVPLVGLAADWNLIWHYYRRRLHQCDLILTDTAGVEALGKEGISHARTANLFGCEKAFLEARPEVARDIDILFVGNMSPAVQRERLSWLGRLSRLGDRWRVVIQSGVFGDAYRQLLDRARIVFNRSIRGECNCRVFEAAAAGALLFQEEGNREVPGYFRDRQECVYYTSENLEKLLDHYLEHEDERQQIAETARTRVGAYTFDKLWEQQLELIEHDWTALTERTVRRPVPEEAAELATRTWQMLGSSQGEDSTLFRDLRQSVAEHPSSALHNSLGLVVSRVNQRGERFTANLAETAAGHFRHALESDPANVMAGLNLAEALIGLQQLKPAVEVAQQTLATLNRNQDLPAWVWDTGHFPPAFDPFRVEWERAAWSHAGDQAAEAIAKRNLLRGRLHLILAELTDSLEHFQASHDARPDLLTTRAALGCALGRTDRSAEAIPFLRHAVADNPFDRGAARALYHALGKAGDRDGQRLFVAERRQLARAAPQLLPDEPWFTASPSSATAGPAIAWLHTLSPEDFEGRYGFIDTSRAVCSYTVQRDAQFILTLLAHARPRRILEIGTAFGHMTANFTEWSQDDAVIFTLGITDDMPVATSSSQKYENPDRAAFGRFTNHFGKAHKVFFVLADSLTYDFHRLAPLDFAFIDGGHDLRHVLSDTLKSYEVLRPGGYIVWHDFDSPTVWVEVRKALEQIRFHEPVVSVAGTQVAFLQKSSAAASPVATNTAASTASGPRFAIVWEGAQRAIHSFALINRELGLRLSERGHEVSLIPSGFPGSIEAGSVIPAGYKAVEPVPIPLPPAVVQCLNRPLSRVDVHVRNQWPPNFTPPPTGHWIIMQPWEFGSLPRAWIGPMTHQVDEVWVHTGFVRDCYIHSGVPADRVQVVPLGVDTSRFDPEARPLAIKTKKKFKFLFVGGTIFRKGIDILLEAYAQAFTNEDDVCLVVKDMGVGTFYRGQTAEEKIAAIQQRSNAPEIEYILSTLTEDALAGLYTACDCLVHPYRGEGFGLPIAEAMACGLPAIVTGYGAALDFCTTENAYLIPATIRYLPDNRVGDLETVDRPWLAEPDPAALIEILRHVVQHPEEARAKGQAGAAHIRAHFTWTHTTEAVERRLEVLRTKPVCRFLHATSEATPTAIVTAADRSGNASVSLCMIVRNEEQNLASCLESVANLVDEVIVVDTGSADRTKEIAARCGAKVFDFPWVDSFAAARNESIRHAQGNWIFWLDADDRLDEENRQKLKVLFAGLKDENAAYVMNCLCLPDSQTKSTTTVTHVRLFRNRPDLRWRYRVHEQILLAVRQTGGEVRWSDVVIHHSGYQDAALRRRKLERDLRLLRLELAEHPDDPFALFNLGSIYQELGQVAEALLPLRRSLELSQPGDSIVRKLYAMLAQSHRHLGQNELALAACRKGREFYPDDIELLHLEGDSLLDKGEAAGAEACWLRALERREGDNHFASVDGGLGSYRTRHKLARLYQRQGRAREAEAQWQVVLAEQPDYLSALVELGDLYLEQSRWTEMEQLAQKLAVQSAGVAAGELRARGLMARKEFLAARKLLEETIAQAPQSVRLRRLLTYCLLQEGKDWMAAEKALHELIALNPNDAEAKSNLAVLLRQQGGNAT